MPTAAHGAVVAVATVIVVIMVAADVPERAEVPVVVDATRQGEQAGGGNCQECHPGQTERGSSHAAS